MAQIFRKLIILIEITNFPTFMWNSYWKVPKLPNDSWNYRKNAFVIFWGESIIFFPLLFSPFHARLYFLLTIFFSCFIHFLDFLKILCFYRKNTSGKGLSGGLSWLDTNRREETWTVEWSSAVGVVAHQGHSRE